MRIPTPPRSQLFFSPTPLHLEVQEETDRGSVVPCRGVYVQQTHPQLVPSRSLIINRALWSRQGLLSLINYSSEHGQAVLRCWQQLPDLHGDGASACPGAAPREKIPPSAHVCQRKEEEFPSQAQPRRINSKTFNSPLAVEGARQWRCPGAGGSSCNSMIL